MHHLPGRLAEVQAQGAVTLLNLGDIERHVADALTVSGA
jgi:hypothetical protein